MKRASYRLFDYLLLLFLVYLSAMCVNYSYPRRIPFTTNTQEWTICLCSTLVAAIPKGSENLDLEIWA